MSSTGTIKQKFYPVWYNLKITVLTLVRVALEKKIQLLFKTILHHDAPNNFFLKSGMDRKLYGHSFLI